MTDPHDLLAADQSCMEAGMYFMRAVTAYGNGRVDEQQDLIAKGREALAKALIRTSPIEIGKAA